MEPAPHLKLDCGCAFRSDDGTLRIRPCCWEHADHWVLLAVEHGLGTESIEYEGRR